MGPIVRIVLRYGIGYLAGTEVGNMLANDPEIVMAITAAAVAAVEGAYYLAKKWGWET